MQFLDTKASKNLTPTTKNNQNYLKVTKSTNKTKTHQTPFHSSTDSFPETLEVGSNILSGTDPDKILEAAKVSYTKTKTWTNPFGDGKTGLKIINILRNELKVSRL